MLFSALSKGVGLSTDSTDWGFVDSPLEALPFLEIEWGGGGEKMEEEEEGESWLVCKMNFKN